MATWVDTCAWLLQWETTTLYSVSDIDTLFKNDPVLGSHPSEKRTARLISRGVLLLTRVSGRIHWCEARKCRWGERKWSLRGLLKCVWALGVSHREGVHLVKKPYRLSSLSSHALVTHIRWSRRTSALFGGRRRMLRARRWTLGVQVCCACFNVAALNDIL